MKVVLSFLYPQFKHLSSRKIRIRERYMKRQVHVKVWYRVKSCYKNITSIIRANKMKFVSQTPCILTFDFPVSCRRHAILIYLLMNLFFKKLFWPIKYVNILTFDFPVRACSIFIIYLKPVSYIQRGRRGRGCSAHSNDTNLYIIF